MQINFDEFTFRPFSPAQNDMEFMLNTFREDRMKENPELFKKYGTLALKLRREEFQWAMGEEDHSLVMVTLEDDIVGFYWLAMLNDAKPLDIKLMDIADFYIIHEYRSQGIGEYLLQRFEREASEEQVTLMQCVAYAKDKYLCDLMLKAGFMHYRTDFIKELSENYEATQANGAKKTQFDTLELRPFDLNRDDIELLVEGEREMFWRSALDFEREKLVSSAHEAVQERIQASNDAKAKLMVAYRGKDFVGYYCIRHSDNALWIDDFYVHPEFRRQGIGTYFIQRIEMVTCERKISYLALQVSNHNTPMYNLALRLGFQPYRIRHVKRLNN